MNNVVRGNWIRFKGCQLRLNLFLEILFLPLLHIMLWAAQSELNL